MLYKDIKTVYNSFSNGGKAVNKYDGRTQSSGQMYRMKVNRDTVRPESITHDSTGYTYNLPEYVVMPQSNPDNGSRRVITLEEMAQQAAMNKAINEGMNKAGKIGAAAMAAGVAPYLIGTVASATPYISKGAEVALKAMNPSSYTGVFGTGAYNTALGGTGTSLAGALADNALASYYGTEATKALIDNWNSNSALSNSANAVYAGLAALPMIPIPKDSKLLKNILPEALQQKGWTMAEDGARISPNGQRFVLNSDGKWQSESSLNISNKVKADKAAQIARVKEQEKLKNEILSDFEDNKITGFSTEEWKAARKGFKTTDSQVAEYESHLPEYHNTFKALTSNGQLIKDNGKWFGLIDGKMTPVNPRHYIISRSKNFQDNGWRYDGYDRGMAIFPGNGGEGRHNVETVQRTGGIGLSDWVTTSKPQQSIFSKQRDDGPVLRGIVSTKAEADRIIPHKYAHEATNNSYRGVTDFDAPIDYRGEKGLWRIFGKDMQIKAIDGNTGAFNKKDFNPLGAIFPAMIGLNASMSD